MGQFEKFAKSLESAEVSLMLAPTAITIYEEKLPALAPVRSQMQTRDEIYGRLDFSTIDCYDALMGAKKDNELYYRTDHHGQGTALMPLTRPIAKPEKSSLCPLNGLKSQRFPRTLREPFIPN